MRHIDETSQAINTICKKLRNLSLQYRQNSHSLFKPNMFITTIKSFVLDQTKIWKGNY